MCACPNHTNNGAGVTRYTCHPLASARPTPGRSHLVTAAHLSAQLPAPQQPLLRRSLHPAPLTARVPPVLLLAHRGSHCPGCVNARGREQRMQVLFDITCAPAGAFLLEIRCILLFRQERMPHVHCTYFAITAVKKDTVGWPGLGWAGLSIAAWLGLARLGWLG